LGRFVLWRVTFIGFTACCRIGRPCPPIGTSCRVERGAKEKKEQKKSEKTNKRTAAAEIDKQSKEERREERKAPTNERTPEGIIGHIG
jgi:hypothetical protein